MGDEGSVLVVCDDLPVMVTMVTSQVEEPLVPPLPYCFIVTSVKRSLILSARLVIWNH